MQVLITGASGLIGKALTETLLEQNFRVVHLSRKKYSLKGVRVYQWNPSADEIDEKALENTDVIINLAGENIIDKPFSEKRKQAIVNSRVLSAKIIENRLKANPHTVKVLINASAIGVYRKNTNVWMEETSELGNDFVAEVVKQWEASAHQFEKLNVRTVIFRIANVLSSKGGAFQKLIQPFKFFVAPVFGTGNQCFSWIHIDDLGDMILKAIVDDKMSGTFNATSPEPLSNKNFIDGIAKLKPAIKIKIPPFALKIILGERADLILDGIKVSPKKIIEKGFHFNYPDQETALKNLLKK